MWWKAYEKEHHKANRYTIDATSWYQSDTQSKDIRTPAEKSGRLRRGEWNISNPDKSILHAKLTETRRNNKIIMYRNINRRKDGKNPPMMIMTNNICRMQVNWAPFMPDLINLKKNTRINIKKTLIKSCHLRRDMSPSLLHITAIARPPGNSTPWFPALRRAAHAPRKAVEDKWDNRELHAT